jgi:hypothetical protein
MWRKLYSNSGLILLAVILLVFSASDVHVQGRGRTRLITFEGTLLKYSPHSKIACGVMFIHQVAKYRVDRVLSGKYDGDEIVVDHPACGGNVFENIPVGSRVRITVRVLRTYHVTTGHPGIREGEQPPKIWYVAGEPPSARTPPEKIE